MIERTPISIFWNRQNLIGVFLYFEARKPVKKSPRKFSLRGVRAETINLHIGVRWQDDNYFHESRPNPTAGI
jgi:hypothetical protein